jgi:hypothetical protein
MSSFQDKDIQGRPQVLSPEGSTSRRNSGFLSFVDDDPATAKRTLAEQRLPQNDLRVATRGPLASLYNTKHSVETYQYPSDLGTGPYQSWITFNILESVETTGDRAYTDQLGGRTNDPIGAGGFAGGSGQQGVRLFTDAINEALQGGAVEQALNSFGVKLTSFSVGQKVRKTKTSISLYVPNTVVFNQRNEYSEVSLTQTFGAALAAAQLVQGSEGSFQQGLQQAAQVGVELVAGEDTRNALLYWIGGSVLNPQIQVIFRMTSLRTFQFDFVLAARNRAEIQAIDNIVRRFRFHAAPRFAAAGSGRYLVPPDEFDIQFMFAGAPHGMIPKISTCVINSVDVDYAPSGNYTLHDDDVGRPTSVRLQLNFQEVDLITKESVARGY